MKHEIRAFIALEISNQMQQELKLIQKKLMHDLCGDISWVKPENTHLTLHFIGNINKQQTSQIKLSLDEIAHNFKKFSIELGHLGIFTSLDNPRVLLAGIKSEAGQLKALHLRIEHKLKSFNLITDYKHFRPHLTLARIKSIQNKDTLKNSVEKLKLRPILTQVRKMSLFESKLTPQGAIHIKIFEVKLDGS